MRRVCSVWRKARSIIEMAKSDIVILQRVVPHYRLELFRRLNDSVGAIVVCSKNSPVGTGLLTFQDEKFIKQYDFKYSGLNPYQCIVPIGQILRELQPKGIIAELSLQMSSTWYLAAMRALGQGPKVMFESHGLNYERMSNTIKNRLLQWSRIRLLKTADFNLCYTKAGKDHLARYISPKRIFVSQNTLPATFNLGPKNQSSAAPVILSVGRMTTDKNFPLLIRAFRFFHIRFPTAKLFIVGDGPDYQNCVADAGHLLGKSVFLEGAIYNENVLAGYFHSASISVIGGAAGLSVNHSLFYGVPVMIFQRTESGPHHHPEEEYVINERTGWQIKPYSAEGLGEALTRVFSRGVDPKDELRDSIRDFVQNEISFDQMFQNWVCASKALLSSPG
jgi:glycosyltransferase involved in cell wall biosynthesis